MVYKGFTYYKYMTTRIASVIYNERTWCDSINVMNKGRKGERRERTAGTTADGLVILTL